MKTKIPILLIATMTLVAPAALAAWSAKGAYEPDTTKDVLDRFMHIQPDWTPASQNKHLVYFNGFQGVCDANCHSVNPNVAQARTALEAPSNMHVVLLGVWKDCNRDGFVGIGEHGLWEYHVQLGQHNTALCPSQASAVAPARPPSGGYGIVHNDGTWIHEFVPIQWNVSKTPTDADINPFNLEDNAARVWWDHGYPETDHGDGGGADCWLSPQPRGTYHNAGGLVRFVDCNSGYRGTDEFNSASDEVSTPVCDNARETCATAACTDEDLRDLLGNTGCGETDIGADDFAQVTFNDSPREQHESSSILNQNAWGDQEDASYAEVWDCGAGEVESVTVGAITLTVYPPSTSPDPNAGGSLSGTANTFGSGFDGCERTQDEDGAFHPGLTLANLPYRAGCVGGEDPVGVPCEAEVAQASAAKISTFMMEPWIGSRPNPPTGLLGKTTPPDLGVHVIPPSNAPAYGGMQDFWVDGAAESGNGAAVSKLTYYATISPALITKYSLTVNPAGASGKYGSVWCGTKTTGIFGGWDCDASHWWKDSEGDIEPRAGFVNSVNYIGPGPDGDGVPIGVRVGQSYNLRDTDCYDESAQVLRREGVSWTQVQQVLNDASAMVREVRGGDPNPAVADFCDMAS